jgi:hypothetical protein
MARKSSPSPSRASASPMRSLPSRNRAMASSWWSAACVVFTTTYSGDLYAFNAATGAILLKTPLSSGSNAPVAIDGDYVIAGAGVLSLSKNRHPLIIAYKLGAKAGLVLHMNVSGSVLKGVRIEDLSSPQSVPFGRGEPGDVCGLVPFSTDRVYLMVDDGPRLVL